jgi:sugar-phosphatase
MGLVQLGCQVQEPFVLAVAGVAGSGKTTLGRALARLLRAPMLDLDTLTNPLLDRLGDDVFGGHWLSSAHAEAVRQGRYAALAATAAEVLETTRRVVLVAPFTRELAGGDEWRTLLAGVAPASVHMVHLVGSSTLFAARRAARGHDRDLHRPTSAAPTQVGIPALSIDARLSPTRQVRRIALELGLDLERG